MEPEESEEIVEEQKSDSEQPEDIIEEEEPSEDPEEILEDMDEEQQEEFVNEEMVEEIEKKERELLDAKATWQMTGEVLAQHRPVGSLLEEELDFQRATKAPLVHTEETISELEELIKQRIRDELFDDPIRLDSKGAGTRDRGEEENADMLDYQKSKKGLAELYEDKFKIDVLHYPRNPEQERVKEEVTMLVKELLHKFEQLTNFHFTPSFVKDEVKISSKVPAFTQEEIVPITKARGSTQAPEQLLESRNPASQIVEINSEYERTDKRVRRLKRKRAIHQHLRGKMMKMKRMKLMEGVPAKFMEKMVRPDKKKQTQVVGEGKTKEFSSSKFFSQMQKLAKDDKEESQARRKRGPSLRHPNAPATT